MAAKDAIDVWKEVRDYITSRLKQRYQTIDEAKEDMNTLYESCMTVLQENYDRFFDKEVFQHLDTYNIEIVGPETDEIISEDELVDEKEPVEENDMFEDEDLDVSQDELNSELGEDLK